jgi:prolyl oligopeptidase
MDAISKKVEDTLIDVKFSGLSWRRKGFILVTKTKGWLSAKTDEHYISINWEQLKRG